MKRLGQYVVACDAYEHAPAMQVADECEVFRMLDGDALAAAVAKHQPDIIVPEIEAIRTERLYDFEKQGIQDGQLSLCRFLGRTARACQGDWFSLRHQAIDVVFWTWTERGTFRGRSRKVLG